MEIYKKLFNHIKDKLEIVVGEVDDRLVRDVTNTILNDWYGEISLSYLYVDYPSVDVKEKFISFYVSEDRVDQIYFGRYPVCNSHVILVITSIVSEDTIQTGVYDINIETGEINRLV